MNKTFKVFGLLVLVIALFTLTGCGKDKKDEEKSTTISYNGDKLKADFKTNEKLKAKISKEANDLRTSREEAIIITDNFKIGIEENDDLAFSNYSGDFKKYKENYKDAEGYKEVKYNGFDGFVRYYGSYVRYEVYLKVSDKYILKLNVYSKEDTDEATKKQFDSKEVQDILKNISIKVK